MKRWPVVFSRWSTISSAVGRRSMRNGRRGGLFADDSADETASEQSAAKGFPGGPESDYHPPGGIAINHASQRTAIASISTRAPLGRAETWTVERAGWSFGKCFA